MTQIRTRNSISKTALKFLLAVIITTVSAPLFADDISPFILTLPLSTKAEQLTALNEASQVILRQYGAPEFKYEEFGVTAQSLFKKYSAAVESATTVEELNGLAPKAQRDVLTADQARHLIIAMNSELHDGHLHDAKPSGGVSAVGIRVASLNGRMFVQGLSKKLKLPENQPALPYDEIVAIDDKPIDEYIAHNLQYINNGTIEARKDEALERILEVPHRILPAPDTSKPLKLTFKRGDGPEFSAEYPWKTIDEIELTRPVLPGSTPRTGDIYAEDTGEFVFRAKGAVRSVLREGIDNLNKSAAAAGKPGFTIFDLGQSINRIRIDNVKKLKANFAATGRPAQQSQIGPTAMVSHYLKLKIADANATPANETQTDSQNKDLLQMENAIEALNSPVTRLQAYVVNIKDVNALILRIPSYYPDGGMEEVLNETGWIAQVLHIAEASPNIHGLFIDQGTNPGGYVNYEELVVGMFGTKEHPIKPMKARVRLSETLLQYYYREAPKDVTPETLAKRQIYLEQLKAWMSEGKIMGPLIPMSSDSLYTGDPDGVIENKFGVTWSKPVVVGIDNADASCAEKFPAEMSDNGKALLFGQNTMGLENPLVNHVTRLNHSEMDIGFPFAEAQRLNGQHIENRGVTPDVIRPLEPEDIPNGFRRLAANTLQTIYMHIKGASKDQIQKSMANQLFNQSVDARTFDKHKDPITKAIGVVTQVNKSLSEISGTLEENSAAYLKIYTDAATALKQINDETPMTEGLWRQVALPLPPELLKDETLKVTWRKDLVVRRLQEMTSIPRYKDKPNTIAFIKNLRDAIKSIPTRLIVNQPCQVFLSRPDVKVAAVTTAQ